MGLLSSIKDYIVVETSQANWETISKDYTDELLAYLVGSDITVFTIALDDQKELYGLTSANIAALNSFSGDASVALIIEKQDLYEYRDIWAEESGAANANNSEWSFGNGATGFMGLPIEAGWEVISMYFHADTYPATGTIQVDLMNYGNTPSNAAANTIASISLSSSTDGGGATNNGYKYESYATPIPVPTTGGVTVIGFITRAVTGTISDERVGARLRRKIGEYVSDVVLA